MHHGHDPQRLFIGRVRDETLPYDGKTKRPRGQIRAAVALMWERHETADGSKYVFLNAPGGSRIILRDEGPNLGEVLGRERVKVETPCHSLSSVQQFVFPLPKVLEEPLAVDGFHLAVLQVIVAAVKHLARLREFFEVSGNDILHQFAKRASGFACEPVELRLELRGKVYFHDFSVRNGKTERNPERPGWRARISHPKRRAPARHGY
jgi:hypothetical protein